MTGSDSPASANSRNKLRREPGTRHQTYSANTVDGVYLKGSIGSGYLNGDYVYLFEFEGGGDEYRWIFDQPIPEKSMELIQAGLRNDPGYREQFRKPAVPAKEADLDDLGALLSRAFGEHSIESNGSIEPGPHSWASRMSVVLSERIPPAFAAFARKCPYLTLSKWQRQDCITVTPPLGYASEANLLFLKAVEDFADGALGAQAQYKLDAQKITTWPTRPEITSKEKATTETSPSTAPGLPALGIAEQIQKMLSASSFKDQDRQLLHLKAGRDEFSKLKASEVEGRMKPDEAERIKRAFPSPKDQLKTMRWVLRGLPLDNALRKTGIDKESTSKLLEHMSASKNFG